MVRLRRVPEGHNLNSPTQAQRSVGPIIQAQRRSVVWRGGCANENMNGLIRQYLPKGTSFENLTDDDIRLYKTS